jgi:hypothetical protein
MVARAESGHGLKFLPKTVICGLEPVAQFLVSVISLWESNQAGSSAAISQAGLFA